MSDAATWKLMGYATLPIRFVQGWIFWGGGSRRFIYDPLKLDPHAHSWMANKLQSAMPGAILGTSDAISYLSQHFYLLYVSIILFSLVELMSGVCLILGFCTRSAAMMSTLVSFILMLTFGWQGATCMDEWTMAAATLAMGVTLMLTGAPVFSLDDIWQRKYKRLASRRFIGLVSSGPLPVSAFKKASIYTFIVTSIFILLTYNYYRGSIFTPYHKGPVSATQHQFSITNAAYIPNGSVRFTMYVDGGSSALPANIIRIELTEKNEIKYVWDAKTLSTLKLEQIVNIYPYNIIHTGHHGLVAPMSAKAIITLPTNIHLTPVENHYQLVVFTINGGRFTAPVDV